MGGSPGAEIKRGVFSIARQEKPMFLSEDKRNLGFGMVEKLPHFT